MANTFDRLLVTCVAAGSTIRTVPAATTSVVIGLVASNISGGLETISVQVAGTSLAEDIPLPTGSTVGLLDGKIVMKAGDTLTASCSSDNAIDIIFSFMDMT